MWSSETVTRYLVQCSTLILSRQKPHIINNTTNTTTYSDKTNTTTTTTVTRRKPGRQQQQHSDTTITNEYWSNTRPVAVSEELQLHATYDRSAVSPEKRLGAVSATAGRGAPVRARDGSGSPPQYQQSAVKQNSARWLTADQVPVMYRQPGIKSGYIAVGSSLSVCLSSLFSLSSNEAANFWSHLLAILYFSSYWRHLPPDNPSHHHHRTSSDSSTDPIDHTQLAHNTWPMLAYLFTVCLYMSASCLAHALGALSPRICDALFFADYAGISMFSYGAGLVCRAYAFPAALTDTAYDRYFLLGSLAISAIGTAAACASRLQMTRGGLSLMQLRCTAFLMPYLWNNAPLLLRLATAPISPNSRQAVFCHIQQMALSAVAGVCYGSGWPERFAPGRFDSLGHSHNLLHLFGTWATQRQMCGMLLDMELATPTYTATPPTALSATPTSTLATPIATIAPPTLWSNTQQVYTEHMARMAWWSVTGTMLALLLNGAVVAVAIAVSQRWRRATAARERVVART